MEKKFMSEPYGNVHMGHVPILLAQKYLARPWGHLMYGAMALKNVKNFWELPLFLAKRRLWVRFAFRDGTSIELDRLAHSRIPRPLLMLKDRGHALTHTPDFSEARFQFAGKEVRLLGEGDAALFVAYHLFLEGDEYPEIDVDGRTLLDVGANIGDTAIYFALLGAKKVIAFEPFDRIYRMAKMNIERNHLGGKVELVKAAVGAKTKSVKVAAGGELGASQIKASEGGSSMRIVGLSEIAEGYKLENAVLKLDCEGFEYEILLGTPDEVLRRFKTIVLEYHYGYLNLKKRLEAAGFAVKLFKPPQYDRNDSWEYPDIRVGIMHAERKGR